MEWYSYKWVRMYGNGTMAGSGAVRASSYKAAEQEAKKVIAWQNGIPSDDNLRVTIKQMTVVN